MAITFIQVTEAKQNTGNTFPWSGTPSAGNALIVWATTFNAATGKSPTYSDGVNTWTVDASGTGSSGLDGLSIGSAPNIAGGATTVTIDSNDTNNSGGVAFVYEFSGLATSSMRDATSPAVKTGLSTAVSTNAVTNATANAVFVAGFGNNGGANPGTVTGTGGGTWVYPAGGNELNGATYTICGTGYNIVSSTGSKSSTWTDDNVNWFALIAVYKAAPAGSTANNGLPGHAVAGGWM